MEAYHIFEKENGCKAFNYFIEAICLTLTSVVTSFFSPRKEVETTDFGEISLAMFIVDHTV
jgi:hypothetical protein